MFNNPAGFLNIKTMKKLFVIIGAVGVVIVGLVVLLFVDDRGDRYPRMDNPAAGDRRENGSGFFGEEPSKNTHFSYFPARLEDFVVPPKMYGLWPYGIRGKDRNSHNEGHPGWDFELKKGSKLYAVTDLKISQIHDGDKQAEGVTVQVIEAAAMLGDKRFGIVYHSVVNIEPSVVAGAEIPAGSVLAEVGFPLSDNSAMIHFGVFQPNDSIGSCPTPYFSSDAQETINTVVALSRDYETKVPYASACVGKISRQIYEENFPERLQYLRGGEPWE